MELAGKAGSLEEATQMLTESLNNGQAWDKFIEWSIAQGGDINQLKIPDTLPAAPLVQCVDTPHNGYIAAIDAAEVGKTCVQLGGGRQQKGDPIDYGVGIVLHAKVGAQLSVGDPLFTIHAATQSGLDAAKVRLLAAVAWSNLPVDVPPHTLKIIE